MTLLLSAAEWAVRRALLGTAHGASLRALGESIASDLDAVLARPLYIPRAKAQLTRAGGRCPADGSLLEFDPFDEHHHRCGTCGEVFTGAAHAGFWRYWYHLWLAERAVHAAILFRLRGDPRHADFATAVLNGYAVRYAAYPNADNALGPSRVFFSTYLESIWLLQLCIALDALEGEGAGDREFGDRIRQAIIEPSRALIAVHDEGCSNRQVWNVAALMAASRLLGDDDEVQRLADAPSGLAALVANGCLADGSWYEGENYHMFAHRGLWYGVTIAERAGAAIAAGVRMRFDAGFLAPFLTMLPDATLPSRRDSQYAISLRQPRFAEHCELGIARLDDAHLAGIAAMLYEAKPDVPPGDNGRQRSSADVERNLPAMRLGRADLGWRSLLFARPELPPVPPSTPRSVHLAGQGIAVFRRDEGRVYAALDYGESGGGHGHPDRLNLLLVDGPVRWLDDMGTGSYVDRSLHWYRSTLAHNAPLVDGVSQRRVSGALLAYDERGAAGWIHARVASIAPGVVVERIVVVMPDYVIDEVQWRADREVVFDLPNHAQVGMIDEDGWSAAALAGGDGLEDGFDFVTEAQRRAVAAGVPLRLGARDGRRMRLDVTCDGASELWRLTAPGAPGRGLHRFHLLRTRAQVGRIRSVWSWSEADRFDVAFEEGRVSVRRGDGTAEVHALHADGWTVDLQAGPARSSIALRGYASRGTVVPTSGDGRGFADQGSPRGVDSRDEPRAGAKPRALPFTARLGEADYRRSETSWMDAGCPEATVTMSAAGGQLDVEVRVLKREPLVFVGDGQENLLDNEPAEINGDGIQLYVVAADMPGGWTIVPVKESDRARGRRVRGWEALPLRDASWCASDDGYVIRVSVELPPPALGGIAHVGVLVNETAPGRARRRGQLVLGGAEGEWVYLRGDRIDPAHLLAVRLPAGHLIF